MPWAWMAIIEIAFSERDGTDDRKHLGARQAETAEAGDLDFDQIAVLGVAA